MKSTNTFNNGAAYLSSFNFLSHCLTCTCASFLLSSLMTRYFPSRSIPPSVENASSTEHLGHNDFTVSMLVPTPYPAFVLKGTTVFSPRLYSVRKLFIGGGSCMPHVGKPMKTIS